MQHSPTAEAKQIQFQCSWV